MKNKINILLVFVLCFICVFFSACASVRSMTITNEDGTISELVSVELDESEVAAAGYYAEELKTNISFISESKIHEKINGFIRDMAEKRSLAETHEEKEKYSKAINGIFIIKGSWSGNTFITGIKFESTEVYNLFYNIEPNDDTRLQEEKHLLYNKVYYTGYSKFYANYGLVNELTNYYKESYPNFIKDESCEFLFTVVSDTKREHSNADYVTKVDGKYYHTWVIETLDEQVELYYNVLNRGNIIWLSMLISIGVLTILGLIVLIKRKSQKNNKKNSQ